MTQKDNLKTILICGLVFISFGGWLLHFRVHPPSANHANLIPFLAGMASVIIIPAMFSYRKTAPYAYILNGMAVIIGVITMAHFSIAHLKGPVTPRVLLLNTTFPDIMMLMPKYFLGKALFDLSITQDLQAPHTGSFLRYPNNGFWAVHLIAMSLAYTVGHVFWK